MRDRRAARRARSICTSTQRIARPSRRSRTSRASGVSAMPFASGSRADFAANSSAPRRDRVLELQLGAISSTSRHSSARLPRTPSSMEQKTSARSRRTLRLSVTRVRPPVPGSTASSGISGSATELEPSSVEHDVIAGERQLVAAARAGALDRADVRLAGFCAGGLECVARLVGELAEIDLVGVGGDAEHADIGAGAKDPFLA